MNRCHRPVLTLVLLGGISAACQSNAPAAPRASLPTPSAATAPLQTVAAPSPPQADWERMKECAQQAERMAAESGMKAGRDGVIGWENHYSSKYRRCFVHVGMVNAGAKKNRDLPEIYDALFDAFEGGLLAMCTDLPTAKANLFCTVQGDGGPKFDCTACRQYVNDRMLN